MNSKRERENDDSDNNYRRPRKSIRETTETALKVSKEDESPKFVRQDTILQIKDGDIKWSYSKPYK